jgi:hypothetical protein
LTTREAFIDSPFIFTLPLSQAVDATVRVLNKRIAHKYLSSLIFSFSIHQFNASVTKLIN